MSKSKTNQIEEQIRKKCSRELKAKAIEVVTLLINLDIEWRCDICPYPVIPQNLSYNMHENEFTYDDGSNISKEKAIRIFLDLFEQKYLDKMVKREISKLLKKIELFE